MIEPSDETTEALPSGLVRRLLSGRAHGTLEQLFRYLMVAGVAFVVDFSSLALLTSWVGIHYLVSAAMAFVLGVTTNYLLSIRWVFAHRSVADRRAEVAIFVAIGVAGLGLNELVMWVVTEHLGRHYLVSKIVSTGLVFFFNFFTRKVLLFRTPAARVDGASSPDRRR